MSERRRLYVLILVLTGASLLVGGVAMFVLYRAAMDEERARLLESAQSQARLIEAVARFDALHSTGLRAEPCVEGGGCHHQPSCRCASAIQGIWPNRRVHPCAS